MRTLRGGGRGLRAKLGAACGGLMRRAGCWQAVVSAGQLVQPLVVRALVLAVSEDGARAKNAALRVTGYIAALTIIVAFAQQRQLHLATRAGTRLRALAIAEVYAAAVLRRRSDAPGDVGTLVGVDATKLMEASLELHLVWAAPLQIVIVSVLLVFCGRRRRGGRGRHRLPRGRAAGGQVFRTVDDRDKQATDAGDGRARLRSRGGAWGRPRGQVQRLGGALERALARAAVHGIAPRAHGDVRLRPVDAPHGHVARRRDDRALHDAHDVVLR